MRHRKKVNHLGRQAGHRKAMLANMANSLILHKRIITTTAKAKALRTFVEPLITKSKEDSTHTRRIVFGYLQSKEAVTELFREVSPKIAERPGGYTRILKTGARLGDNADMCVIELVDYNQNLLSAKEDAAKAGRKRRRGGKKTGEAEAPAVKAKAAKTAPAAVAEENLDPVIENIEVKAEDEQVMDETAEDKKEE
jgi:large subunit ribosomal protein L17